MLVEQNTNEKQQLTWGTRDTDTFRVATAVAVAIVAAAAVWMC
jgi:hypothetical protein